MPRNVPVTAAERQQVLELHAAGKTRNDIARATGLGAATVSKVAAAAGLTFDRAGIAAATEARKADAKSRRAELELLYLAEAKRLLAELRQPVLVYNFGGKDNTYEERLHDEPDAAAKLKLVQASGVVYDRAQKIAELDSDQGVDVAKSLLTELGRKLGIIPPAAPDAG